jgi:hypothetical protein
MLLLQAQDRGPELKLRCTRLSVKGWIEAISEI